MVLPCTLSSQALVFMARWAGSSILNGLQCEIHIQGRSTWEADRSSVSLYSTGNTKMSFWTVSWSCLLRPLGNGFCSRDIKGGLWGRADATDIQGSMMLTGPNGVSFHNTSFRDVQYWQYHKKKKKIQIVP